MSTGVLRRSWAGWKRIARTIGDVQSRLLLSVVYVTVIVPFGLVLRCAADPLALDARTPKGWRPLPRASAPTAERARQQF